MKVLHEETKKKGEFYVEANGERLAKMQYFYSRPGEINIYHTEVDKSLAGKGVGRDLVAAGVAFARNNNLKVIASCSYAKSVIDKTPEFQDVLA